MFRLIRACLVSLAACFALLVRAEDLETLKCHAEEGDAKAQFTPGEIKVDGFLLE
jgi:hypothetical protein